MQVVRFNAQTPVRSNKKTQNFSTKQATSSHPAFGLRLVFDGPEKAAFKKLLESKQGSFVDKEQIMKKISEAVDHINDNMMQFCQKDTKDIKHINNIEDIFEDYKNGVIRLSINEESLGSEVSNSTYKYSCKEGNDVTLFPHRLTYGRRNEPSPSSIPEKWYSGFVQSEISKSFSEFIRHLAFSSPKGSKFFEESSNAYHAQHILELNQAKLIEENAKKRFISL